MPRERQWLKARLHAEYRILDNAIRRKAYYKTQKDHIGVILVNWTIKLQKQKIHEYKLEIEILGELGRLG